MKTNLRFSRNVCTISDRTWCNKHLRHTTTEKYEKNGKGGYFRFDVDNNMSYRYILSITLLKRASWTPTTPYCIIQSEVIRYLNNIICINSYNSTGTIITRNITNVTWQQVSEMIDMNRWIQWLFPWCKEKSDFLHVSPSLKNYITLCFEIVDKTQYLKMWSILLKWIPLKQHFCHMSLIKVLMLKPPGRLYVSPTTLALIIGTENKDQKMLTGSIGQKT